jgi:hypothetical protein
VEGNSLTTDEEKTKEQINKIINNPNSLFNESPGIVSITSYLNVLSALAPD